MHILLSIIVLIGVGSCVYFGPNIKEHFGTRYGNADRKIFEQTQSHVHGTIANLSRLKLEYATASAGHKIALREMILTEVSTFDRSKLPYSLQVFVQSLEQ